MMTGNNTIGNAILLLSVEVIISIISTSSSLAD